MPSDALSRLPLPSSADGTGARLDEEEDTPGELALALCNTDQEPEGEDSLYGWLVSPTAEEALALQSRAVCTVRALALATVGGGMDGVAPAYDELLCDCRCTAMYDSPHDGLELATSYQQARLRNKAAGWVEAAGMPGRGGPLTPVPQGHGGMGIDTTPLGPELYADLEAGVCVLEFSGGIGAVLEGLLRNCVRVCAYVDNDTEARQAMAHRLLELHERYPQQLPPLCRSFHCPSP